jgi:DNA topoisomerase-1
VAGIGRFGPYVKHQTTYASLEPGDEVLTIGLNRAVTLIAEKMARGPGRGRRGKPAGRALGEHPTLGGPVTAHDGRYGPYVSHNKINATLPSTADPATVSLEEAVELIAAREGKGGKKAKAAAKPKKEKKAKAVNGDGLAEDAPKAKKKPAKKKAPPKKKKTNGADEAKAEE